MSRIRWYNLRDAFVKFWALFMAIFINPITLEAAIENAKSSGPKRIIIMGALNGNMLAKGNRLEPILDQNLMTQLIHDATHITQTSSTLIDIAATTSADLVKEVTVASPSLSNHSDISITLTIKTPKIPKIRRTVYDYSNADWAKMNQLLREQDWEPILQTPDINNLAENWTETYLNIAKKSIPTKTISCTASPSQWITHEVEKAKRDRDKAHKKAKRTKREEDWANFRRQRNKVQNDIKKSKARHYDKLGEKIMTASEANDKLWWNLTK